MPFLNDARAPEGLRLYAIGDVHGRLDLLRDMHARIARDLARRPARRFRIIHLGDLVDRGPDSAGVIERVREFCADGDAVALAGNHDRYFLDFLDGRANGAPWLDYGGEETALSYGVEPRQTTTALRAALRAAVPLAHRAFLEAMPLTERHGDYLFVHAGVRPGRRLERQKPADLVMIRQPFLDHDGDLGAVVVHGHTAGPAPVVRRNRIGLDTRAYESGVLSCLALEGAERLLLTPDGPAALPPPG